MKQYMKYIIKKMNDVILKLDFKKTYDKVN
jgi:hypothetical protein